MDKDGAITLVSDFLSWAKERDYELAMPPSGWDSMDAWFPGEEAVDEMIAQWAERLPKIG